jgi:hypothetical protein
MAKEVAIEKITDKNSYSNFIRLKSIADWYKMH